LLLYIGLHRGTTGNPISNGWGAISTVYHWGRGGMVWGNTASSGAGKTHRRTVGHTYGATHLWRKTSLSDPASLGITTNVGWRATTVTLHVAATTATAATITVFSKAAAACITHVKCHGIHSIDELMHGSMLRILIGRKLHHLLSWRWLVLAAVDFIS
jgi:hypothetical protein